MLTLGPGGVDRPPSVWAHWRLAALVVAFVVCAAPASGAAGLTVARDAAQSQDGPVGRSLLRTFLATDATAVVNDGGFAVTVTEPRAGVAFTDRPDRRAFRFDPVQTVARWSTRYGDDPPNVVLAGVAPDGTSVARAVTVTSASVVDTERLQFSMSLLGDPAGRSIPPTLSNVSVFIDEPGTTEVGEPERATGKWMLSLGAPNATVNATRPAAQATAGTTDIVLSGLGIGIGFTDQPVRRWVRIDPQLVPSGWREAFGDDPPNAVLSGITDAGRSVAIPVTVLAVRSEEGDAIGFTVRRLGRRGPRSIPVVLRDAVLSIDEALSVDGMDSPCAI